MKKLTSGQLDQLLYAVDVPYGSPTITTDDPIINFYADVETGVEDEFFDWDELPDGIKKLYRDEAKLYEKIS